MFTRGDSSSVNSIYWGWDYGLKLRTDAFRIRTSLRSGTGDMFRVGDTLVYNRNSAGPLFLKVSGSTISSYDGTTVLKNYLGAYNQAGYFYLSQDNKYYYSSPSLNSKILRVSFGTPGLPTVDETTEFPAIGANEEYRSYVLNQNYGFGLYKTPAAYRVYTINKANSLYATSMSSLGKGRMMPEAALTSDGKVLIVTDQEAAIAANSSVILPTECWLVDGIV
jgi:hypothetical protein